MIPNFLFLISKLIKVYAVGAGGGEEVDALPAHQQAEEGEDAEPESGALGFGVFLTDMEEKQVG